MKPFLLAVLVLLLAGLAALAWSFSPARLDTSGPATPFTPASASPPASMRLSAIRAGHMESQQLFSWRGGEPGTPFVSGMMAALVEHPAGDLLIDTGFGRDVDTHFLTTPWLMQTLASYEAGTPAVDQMASAGYDASRLKGIWLTHLHWDHVSGLPDFPGVPVHLPASELDFMRSGDEAAGLLASMADGLRFKPFQFREMPYENFARSLDLYGDGAVVLVPLPGHTPGSTGIFVNLPSGKRYFFIGDLAWAAEGIDLPAERPWLARRLVDRDVKAVRRALVRVHRLAARYPEMIIVPAHDARVHERMAVFPAREG